ncbi:isochorismatase family protein [Gordonia desulfuricans]|uniref:Isochorismatase family protein n=1 Tax=Gordonia desulfuricans TaxID=89051 RepID=A0A7K3LLR1_9ACTN|nr:MULTISPECIES: isochorismatase family protein [Gordonia]EMP11298.1 isochorismatase [Gordonia sp. NB41Y]NDK89192.1 isochorismatase family protein [Gordonia desulfuricans]WLP89411.1 isochorismatase family protein [Gordonia sp. NB41Y]
MTAPRRALVIVDVQNEYFQPPMQVQYPPVDDSLANILRAIDTATEQGLPIVALQHTLPAEAPVYAEGSHGWKLHPEIERRVRPEWKLATKQFGTVFGGTDVAEWLSQNNVDTITVVGYMTNNCDLATAAEAEVRGLSAEILSDATGAIHLANDAGKVSAEVLHNTLMVLYHSNFAAVATTGEWLDAVNSGAALAKSNLVESAISGAQAQG